VVVDASGDPEVASLLEGLEGGTVLAGTPGAPRAASLDAGLAATSAELVWFGATDHAPGPGAVRVLAEALGDAALALPHADPGPFGLVRRAALDGGGFSALRSLETVAAGPTGRPDGPEAHDLGPGPWGAAHVDIPQRLPGSVRVGHASYGGRGTVVKTWAPTERIEIGAYCSLADDVKVLNPGSRDLLDAEGNPVEEPLMRGFHRAETATTFPIGVLVPDAPFVDPPSDGSLRSAPLIIGNDVWIGFGATVLGPLTIGDGAIVGAGSVVTRDVAPYTVVGGMPARELRPRFEPALAERLGRIAWWRWPEAMVRANWRWFTRPAAEFAAHFDPAGEA
jgi:acetyltransferase-like isoleucine patch superfamily enzyme